MTKLYKELFGRGPTKVRAAFAGPDTVVVSLENTMTQAERNMVKGENFAIEVRPEHFDFIEGVFEPPEPSELEGAIISESA